MRTAELLPPSDAEPGHELAASTNAARISFRQPLSRSGFIDAARWPRSLDLTAERILLLAGEGDGAYRAEEILTRAGCPDAGPRDRPA
jgi:hypothetical protein